MYVSFERVHRLGQKSDGRPRHIIAKFCYFKDREKAWLARSELGKENIWLMEDFPQEVLAKRKLLYPAFKAAQRSTEIKSVNLKADKLCVDGQTFTVDQMHKLPPPLKPDRAAVIETDSTVVFFTKHAIFSNLYPLPIRIGNHIYNCNEQYLQHSKATMFGDSNIANKIKDETDPYAMMSLAREIKGYKHGQWLQQVKKILKSANEAKYRQNDLAKDALLATGNKLLGKTLCMGLVIVYTPNRQLTQQLGLVAT